MNCAICIHWNSLHRHTDESGRAVAAGENTQSGECRCNPPTPSVSVAGAWRAFPVTRFTDCCGKFLVKEQVVTVVPIVVTSSATLVPEPKKRGRPRKNIY